MAYFECAKSISRPAGADLSDDQFKFVDIDASGNAALVGTAGAKAAGILFNDPVSGQAAEIVFSGVAKVQLGGTVTAGDAVTSNATGLAIEAGSGNIVHGICIEGGASGQVGTVLLHLNGYAAS